MVRSVDPTARHDYVLCRGSYSPTLPLINTASLSNPNEIDISSTGTSCYLDNPKLVLFSSLSYARAMLIAASLGAYVCYTLYCSRVSLREAGAEVQNLRSTSLRFSLLAGEIFFPTGATLVFQILSPGYMRTSMIFDVSRAVLKLLGGVCFFARKDILMAWLGVLRRVCWIGRVWSRRGG
ncbi:hypothetical protein FA15DRAFT_671447 [Coprinopsis marcescibilis]|uniref:Uncharacterized protein n=1 Tax=Coprinopsis marcescibilis TaxID=230819 RepID=A0A5C3KQ85_COPMA|nr:hypothetical protein FA15DRAFT_671447 [Coprinopsis marcescibilis]